MIGRVRGFTIVELLIAVVVIGVLAGVTVAAYTGLVPYARSAKANTDLKNIKQAFVRLEIDTGVTAFGCAGGGVVFGPERTVDNSLTGLVVTPTVGAVTTYNTTESCTWDAAAVAAWKGPYIPSLKDPAGRSYWVDLDYFICENGVLQMIAAVVYTGYDGILEYPGVASGPSCVTGTSDDAYLELYR